MNRLSLQCLQIKGISKFGYELLICPLVVDVSVDKRTT